MNQTLKSSANKIDILRQRFLANIGRFLRRHSYALIALFLLGLSVYNLSLSIYPLDADNLAALDLAANQKISSLLTGSSALGLPYYRPIPFTISILQYQVFGLDTYYFFLFNLGVWIICVWCVYFLVAYLSKSRLSAVIAAALVLLDPRAITSLVWIGERQSSMSGLFGLGAILLAIMPYQHRWRYFIWSAIFLLLLMAPLSKEYGLVFSGTLILFVMLSKNPNWKTLTVISLLAVTTYGIIRIYSGVTSITGYCEVMGFFREEHMVCYKDLTLSARLQQNAYNVGASFLGTMFPGIFSVEGAMKISSSAREILLVSVPIFLLAFFGLIKSYRNTLPLFALILLNAILNFVLYRGRNQLVGMLGLYAAAGIGLAYLIQLSIFKRYFIIKWAGVFILMVLLSWQITKATTNILRYYENTKELDPCPLAQQYHVDMNLVHLLKEKYQMNNPDCGISMTGR